MTKLKILALKRKFGFSEAGGKKPLVFLRKKNHLV